jgi:hypothetical protein
MNILRFKQLFLIFSLAGVLVAVGGRSAQAETLQPASSLQTSEAAVAQTSASDRSLTVQEEPLRSESASVVSAEAVPPLDPAETSATALQTDAPDETLTAQPASPQEQPLPDTTIAQAIDPGRATRSGSSYIGIGGNIGFGGDTGLGTGNFAIISKVGLTPNLSLRPSALVGDGATFLLPATVDFPIAVSTEVDDARIGLAPYIGGGVAISTGDDSEVQPLVTAGVDVPITSDFTANASANVSFPDDVEVGVILGIGYNFR